MQARSLIGWAGLALLDLVLPARCLTCDATVATPGQLCPDCFRATEFLTDPCCHRCGQPFSHAGMGGRTMECADCTLRPPPWRQARAALRYDAQSRRIILPFKHGDRVDAATGLARHMARAGAALLREADWLVPVPLHRSRLLRRRYNQSALLVQALARLTDRPALLDGLRRVRATASLGGLNPAQRRQAVGGAFTVPPAGQVRIEGSRVLLVDDVLTRGPRRRRARTRCWRRARCRWTCWWRPASRTACSTEPCHSAVALPSMRGLVTRRSAPCRRSRSIPSPGAVFVPARLA